jgi:uracil-DNA glycosylase family 4
VPPAWPKGKPHFAIVGEDPGRREIFTRVPFTGPSGRLLDNTCAKAGLDREEALVTNAILCGGIDGDDRKVKQQATACCAKRLAKELAQVEGPILTLGPWALQAVLGIKRIYISRGFIWQVPDVSVKLKNARRLALKNPDKLPAQWLLEGITQLEGRVVLPSVHPEYILRGAEGWQPVLQADFRRFRRLLDGGVRLLDGEAYATYRTLSGKTVGRIEELGDPISLDVETDGIDPLRAKLLCVGLSDGVKTLVIHPWRREYASALSKCLATRTVVMHNGPQYDFMVLAKARVKIGNWEDTLLANHAFASHLPKRLDHVVSVFLDSGPWKIAAGKRAE